MWIGVRNDSAGKPFWTKPAKLENAMRIESEDLTATLLFTLGVIVNSDDEEPE